MSIFNRQVTENLQPSELVIHLAERKAKAVFAEHQHRVVLGADTIVALDNTILGKPKSRADAFKMLRMLSGQSHFVYTGVAILSAERTAIFYFHIFHQHCKRSLSSFQEMSH